MNNEKKDILSSTRKYLIFIVFPLTILLGLCTILTQSKEIDIQKPDPQWQIRTLENGENVLFNPSTEEMIYRAFITDRNGIFIEIPLNEYIILKNTTTTITNKYEKIDKNNIVFSQKDFIYKTEDIGVYWTSPEKITADIMGPVLLTMGDEVYELPEGYIFYDMETKLIKLILEETYFKMPYTNNIEIKVRSDIKYSEVNEENLHNTVIREIRMKKIISKENH